MIEVPLRLSGARQREGQPVGLNYIRIREASVEEAEPERCRIGRCAHYKVYVMLP
jgi:hypothetical protein